VCKVGLLLALGDDLALPACGWDWMGCDLSLWFDLDLCSYGGADAGALDYNMVASMITQRLAD